MLGNPAILKGLRKTTHGPVVVQRRLSLKRNIENLVVSETKDGSSI